MRRSYTLALTVLWQAISIILSVASMMSVFDARIEWHEIFRNFIDAYQNVLFPFWAALYDLFPFDVPEAWKAAVYNFSTLWSVMFVSLNLVMLTTEDTPGAWWSVYPRMARGALRSRQGETGMVLVALRLGFATLIFLLSILVPPLFLLLSGLLGDGCSSPFQRLERRRCFCASTTQRITRGKSRATGSTISPSNRDGHWPTVAHSPAGGPCARSAHGLKRPPVAPFVGEHRPADSGGRAWSIGADSWQSGER